MRKLWAGVSAGLVSVLFAACGGGASDPSNEDEGTGGNMEPAGDGDGDTSATLPCEEGEFGPACQPCTCEHGVCKDGRFQDGSCSQCDDGYWGKNCSEECPEESDELGMGGAGLVSQCLDVSACEMETGLPSLCEQCAPGFYGKDCSKYCPDNQGNCLEVVECSQGGTPTMCNSCKDGFWGEACEKPCNGNPDHCTEVNVCDEFGDPVTCTCEPGWRGALCDERKVFVVYDNFSEGTSPGERAAQALGFTISSHLWTSEPALTIAEAYQAETWDAVIVDLSFSTPTAQVLEILVKRAQDDETLVVSYWNLDEAPTLAEALGVTPIESYDEPFPLVVGADSPIDVFDLRQSIPSPLFDLSNSVFDSGDLLSLVGPGAILLRETTSDGDGILTRVGHKFTLGFTPKDYLENVSQPELGDGDVDNDGKDDIVELYMNLLTL